ncbi:hypothetical protein K505DRAFT_254340 [Melanomma pulvis-pyrius CBS 109.77]|uniref:Nuclear matrix protein n=1 Tax=Melanomma pulvis-pyrius CBS 109.77 TaxID=1314802 RepID=A0A6A6WXZ2_9PLEO|nr:hypothetical protein K505DRAFT_254340 [Melanomma pulvis-pyrius CBS 109.77]
MAVADITSNNAIAAKLTTLLQHARSLKQSNSIDPPLQVSELVTDNEPLLGNVTGDKDLRMLAVDSAAKNIFYGKLGSTPISEPSFVDVWNLLDILQYCGDRELSSQQLVLLLIEELLDSQSISGCRSVFSYLESRREAIIANNNKSKDLVILRLCNELLRRLSRAEDPVFCGRVYIFMFQSFPLGDKSSVNLRGNFHVENVTTFEDYLQDSAPDEDEMEVENVRTEETAEEQPKPEDAKVKPAESGSPDREKPSIMDIDTLYPVFWSLQHSFSNPPRLFEEENFKQFQQSLEATLAKFKQAETVSAAADSDRKKGAKPRSDDEFASTFNPKYLTSRDLFKLELSDLAFQRHILVQALILIDFLLTLTDKSKQKPYYANAQKAMQYSFMLREEDTEWALGIKTSIANYLQEGSDGKFYYRMVDTVLSRDKNWVRWKMENCHPFTRDRVSSADFLGAKPGAQQAVRRTVLKALDESPGLEYMSSDGTEKGLAKLKEANSFTPPSAESYAKIIQMADLDLEMATSEEEKRKLEEQKSSNTWRGLRLASKNRLSLFDRPEHGKGSLERLFQPGTSIEAAGEDNAPTSPEVRDSVPQQSVEEQRADQRSQVTTE